MEKVEREIGEIFFYHNMFGNEEKWQCVAAISDDCSGCYNGGPDNCTGCEFPHCDSTYYPDTINRKKIFGACRLFGRTDKHNVIFKKCTVK